MRMRLSHAWFLAILMGLPLSAHAVSSGLYATTSETSAATKVALPRQSADAPVTLSADAMAMDEPNNIVIARGNVEVLQGESILTADQITYYANKDLVVAEGNVSMLQPTGDVYFADKAELKDGMKQAVIHDFKARFSDNSVLVAQKAVRVSSAVTTLKKAAYTPCNLCKNVAPFWEMDANSAIVDDVNERVTYRDAHMEMFGYPMFYTPYLSHPTPTAAGKSGFLTPSYNSTPYFGAVAKVPYYWRIGEDKDVVLTPWFTTTEGPLLHWNYHQLTNNGNYHVEGSITNPKARDNEGNTTSGQELRGHIFAQGDEEIGEHTHLGFDIERASDDTYLRRYGFGGDQALFSRAYVEQAQGRNFALAQGVSIQGMRSADSQRTTPLVLPILQGYYETPADAYGIKYHVSGDAQMLAREEGADQRRISITPGASLPFVTENGQLLTATVNLRGDLYDANDVPINGGTSVDGTTARFLPQAALEWRYPLINTFKEASWLVEPVMLGVLQPNGGNSEKISNEDSKLIELTDTNLFSIDRMPGLDLYDSGSRVAYGMRSQYYAQNGVVFDGLLGQNYDFNSDTPYPNSTAPGQEFSDYIGRVASTYAPVTFSYRFALDKDNGTLNRSEIGFGFSKPWFSFDGSYRTIKNNNYLNDSREGIFSATLPLSDAWSIYGGARRDFEINQMVTANGGVIYKNECFNIMLDTLRSYTRDRDIEPTTIFTFRVGFKNLGEFGGN